ncbi:MAG: hypothetical protein U5K43_09365 [Halofilum sp. (in: g-proteobacteria)]|nr:hypothetical protein [Halofilum sp. (in: g-proteobacteria)]
MTEPAAADGDRARRSRRCSIYVLMAAVLVRAPERAVPRPGALRPTLPRRSPAGRARRGLRRPLPPFAHAIGDPYLISIVTRGVILAIAVAGLDFILGYGALVSFGHAAFVGAGAYTVAILAHHARAGTPLRAPGARARAPRWRPGRSPSSSRPRWPP